MSKKLKILAIHSYFYPHRGGSQKYSEELHKALIEKYPETEVDVLCYNTENAPEEENYKGLHIYRIPCWEIIPARFALPRPIPLLKKLKELQNNNYNIVNTHIRFFDPTWWSWFFAKKIGAKSVCTVHVASHPTHQNLLVKLIARLVDKTIAKWSLQKYDLVTVTNKCAKQFFAEKFGIKNSALVYGGVDTKLFHPQEKETERKIPKIDQQVGADKILATYVGRVIWTKGVTYLYKAVKEMSNTANILFVLAGPGKMEQQLKEDVAKNKLEGEVFLTGNLNYEEVQKLLSVSNIFINPSHHNEGFPNTILEAMASGCFVIATDNAGTKEVVKDKETGLLIPQKNAEAIGESLEWALENKEKRKEIAQNARELMVNEFDWRVICEKYYKELSKILGAA